MKYTTLDEIEVLSQLRTEKMARIAHIERTIANIRATYKEMTDEELLEAIKEVNSLNAELEEERVWCEHARAEINAFFTPAIL